MDSRAILAREATALLMAVARGDTSAVAQYDDLLAPLLLDTAKRRGSFLARDAAARAGAANAALKDVHVTDQDEVAGAAVERALRRARASALRFDPKRGDGASWALGALGYAYLEVAREMAGSRRIAVEIPTEDEALNARIELERNDPYVQVEVRDALQRALGTLDEDEKFVILARLHYGLSYREIALIRFRDSTETKQVDRVLQRARAKLRDAHASWVREA